MRPIIRLTKTQQNIYVAVDERPRTARELIDATWWVHPQDAPQLSCIKAHINQMNRKLCYRGLQIRADDEGRYHIRTVKPHGYPKRKPARDQNAAGLERTQSAGPPRLDR
jgi:hypothetical protein